MIRFDALFHNPDLIQEKSLACDVLRYEITWD